MPRTEIRIAGFGGQGVVLAGVLLGTAAILRDDKHAIQTQSYGAAARGGAARSDVIISDEKIMYPQVTAPDIMAAFTTEALNKYKDELKKGATLIIDEDLVTPPEDSSFKIYRVPATSIASNELGKGIVANMVMLGFLSALTGIVSLEALEETIRANVPKGTEELNLTAFRKGVERAQEVK
ncbi:MAG: 2-oxoacid:acceptor oxidoreductase family protein [Candidatus Latescibacteria bacterium]|nr:2-oxoacid:acceptor oxidoreductase family protein [Candidatus Latescibacterota bacterium]